MLLISKLKGFYLIATACDGLLMLSLDLFSSCIKPTWYDIFQDVLLKCLTLVFLRVYNDTKGTGQRNEDIMSLRVFPSGCHDVTPSFSLQKSPGFLVFLCEFCS